MILIMWLDGGEHPWFFFLGHSPRTEKQKVKNKTTYYTISPNEIRKDSSHKASPQGYRRPCGFLAFPIYRGHLEFQRSKSSFSPFFLTLHPSK
jgi:hypothetical protein